MPYLLRKLLGYLFSRRCKATALARRHQSGASAPQVQQQVRHSIHHVPPTGQLSNSNRPAGWLVVLASLAAHGHTHPRAQNLLLDSHKAPGEQCCRLQIRNKLICLIIKARAPGKVLCVYVSLSFSLLLSLSSVILVSSQLSASYARCSHKSS